MTHPNQQLLDSIDPASWRHFKKTKSIWARRLEQPQAISSREGELQANAGDYLCRGIEGESWPQSADKLNSKYSETQNVDADGWQEFQPRADAEGAYAVAIDDPFHVTSTYGVLEGRAGDYVVKHATDRLTAYPDDVWIVARSIFVATYEAVI
jgi:hypothetical protein